MVWLGWIVAALAVAGAFWISNLLRAERARSHELLCEKMELENALDDARSTAASHADEPSFGHDALIEVADRIDAPLGSARAQFEDVSTQIDDYRQRVREFDVAVQYCLQPVEMIFGADKATLDELVKHVEGARRKLFEARASLQKSPLHGSAASLDGGLEDIEVLASYARALRIPPAVAQAHVEPAHEPLQAEIH